MTAKLKARARLTPLSHAKKPSEGITLKSPLTLEEHLHCIETLGKRIDAYIHFMVQLGNQTGTSAEVKDRAVVAFYQQMIIVERELGHIHDELRLE